MSFDPNLLNSFLGSVGLRNRKKSAPTKKGDWWVRFVKSAGAVLLRVLLCANQHSRKHMLFLSFGDPGWVEGSDIFWCFSPKICQGTPPPLRGVLSSPALQGRAVLCENFGTNFFWTPKPPPPQRLVQSEPRAGG